MEEVAVITDHLREAAVRLFLAPGGLPLLKEPKVSDGREGADAEWNVYAGL